MEVDTNELLHRIGAVLRVISNKMDQLIEIVERAGGEVWFPSEEESKTFADILMDDACIPSDAVADEPPKKWRILEPGEVVCSSDWVTAKTSPPSDPPNGLGWRPVDASVGTSVCQDDPCIFARLVADEPAKKAEPEHPAGPMPDPGEGYRILAKNPPEDLQPGDDWWEHDEQRWRGLFPVDTTAQYSRTWYRRKIEPAKEAQPAKPKRWRILDDKETIQAGEWYNAKVNKPRRWPPHGGWQELGGNDICIGSPAGKFPNLLWCREVTDDAEPPKPPEPEYREPVLPADAGKECEFSDDGNAWTEGELRGYAGCFWQSVFGESKTVNRWYHARIKKDA